MAEREERGFREIEHTADVGVEVEGESPRRLFSVAAEGFYALIADPSGIEPGQEISVSVTGAGWEDLLQAWLSELLAQFNLQGFIGKYCAVTSIASDRVDGRLKGEVLDLKRHRFYTEIKGVTYHGLKVWQADGKWHARVIFDV